MSDKEKHNCPCCSRSLGQKTTWVNGRYSRGPKVWFECVSKKCLFSTKAFFGENAYIKAENALEKFLSSC